MSKSNATVVLGSLGFGLAYIVVFALTYMVCFPVIARIASLEIFHPSSPLPKHLDQFVRDAGARATANLGAFCLAALAGGAAGGGIARLISELFGRSGGRALQVSCGILLAGFILAPIFLDWKHVDVVSRIVALVLSSVTLKEID